MALSGAEILDYACLKFKEEKYDEALEAFILAYENGYEKEQVLDHIYQCYVIPNEAEFQTSFEQCKLLQDITYEKCELDFIPYQDGVYYIFDKKEKIFQGKLSVQALLADCKECSEFDDVAIELEWDWRKYPEVFAWSKRHKVYAICTKTYKAVSFCKIPELKTMFEKFLAFSSREEYQLYFHLNTGVYLPREFAGEENDQYALKNIWEEEHAYRLTPQGRNRENILLTIGIPSFARGHLALEKVTKLLEMVYDAEIEITVSKNGDQIFEEEYKQIGEITDARVCYTGCAENIGPPRNWRRTVEISHGEYVLFVSDEDEVIIPALDHYFDILRGNKKLSYVRAKTVKQYPFLETQYANQGAEAFQMIFLGQNYLSGAIVKRSLFLNLPFQKIEEKYGMIIFYQHYCHDWWFSLLCFQGDAMNVGLDLILEGDDYKAQEYEEIEKKGKKIDEDFIKVNYEEENGLHLYAQYESRLEQFEGYIIFLHTIEEYGMEVMKAGLNKAICKATLLIHLAYANGFRREEIADVLDQFAKLCINAVNEFPLENADKEELLNEVIKAIQFIMTA